MEYIKCEKMFRRGYNGVRTYWSLVCEALYRFGDMTKDEVIEKIGYCGSQSQVWSSLKHWGMTDKVKGSWKIHLTGYGRQVLEEGAKAEGIDLDHRLEGEAWRKLCLSQFQVHEMNKDF